MNKKLMLGIGIPVAIILLLVMWYVGTYNSLIRLNEETNNKWFRLRRSIREGLT